MNHVAAFLVCLFFLASSASATDVTRWSDCGTPQDHYKISSVELVPNPPRPGQNISIYVHGEVDEVVSGGQVVTETYYVKVRVHRETNPLCDLALCSDPPQSPWIFTKSAYIPPYAPRGPYRNRLIMTDQNDQPITCLDVMFNLVAA